MLCFFRACCTVLKVRKVMTAYYQTCLAALSCAAVPESTFSGVHLGAVGFTQRVGPAVVDGATMASIARGLAWSSLRTA
jgi:hypothetical protein